MPNQNQEPTLYSLKKTTMWFAIVSLILLGSLVLLVTQDYSREWKEYQKKFIELKIEKIKEELRQANQKIDKTQLDNLVRLLQEVENALKEHRADYSALQKEADAANVEAVKAKTAHQNLKQFEDSFKFFFEKYQERDPRKAEEYDKKLKRLQPKIAAAKLRLEQKEKQKQEKEAKLSEFTAQEKKLDKEIRSLEQEKIRVEKKLKAIEPTLAKEILNAPMIDFAAPSLRIQQVVLEDLYDDYHFTRVNKVDRCTTCHLAIDQRGFENAPQPFKTHPNFDLYLSASSSHPLEKTGCTVCHGGNGHSVNFVNTAHTPDSAEQKKEWQKKYHWRPLEN